MVIDSHHHFWRYDAAEYGWISDSMSILRKDFLSEDLKAEIGKAGIDGVVSVQARQSLSETRWLLGLASKNDFIRGVVGWVPLASPDLRAELERFAGEEKLKSVRHVLQDEPDDDFMLRPDFDHGIGILKEFGLRYDILIFGRHLTQAIKLVDRHPELTFILDHIAKPKIRENVISPWRENLVELARRPNVYCKLSGMVTESDHRAWTEAQLRPYMDTALEAFGPRRLMFGTDWPVCLLACSYQRWYEIVYRFSSVLSVSERQRLMGGTAIEAYGLS
jgi:L-fuconolactonase